MAQVDFYILADNSRRSINQMVCRLCEKALGNHMNVLIYTRSDQQAIELDELLWTFKSDSFIPHCIISDGFFSDNPEKTANFSYPVVIKALDTHGELTLPGPDSGSQHADDQSRWLLINLSQSIPGFIQHFERIAEMVDKNETEKQEARERYRLYRQQGHALNKYDL